MSLLLPFALVGCTPDAPVQPVGAPHTAAPDTSAPTAASTGETGPAVTGTAPGPVVVLVIGDGMGPAHLSAASVYRHGVDGGLAIHALPAQGTLRTASLSGITDSAAAATVLAAGAHTLDGRVAIDRYGSALPTIVDAARDRGWATAVVTTSRLPHATPAAFTAHHLDRDAEVAIADQQVGAVDVLLGGGASWYLPSDDPRSVRPDGGLLGAMAAAGVTWIEDPAALATAQPPMIGAFAASHLPSVGERPEGSASLQQLVDAAIAAIGDDPEGALLIVEGARIDHASHDNDLERAIGELLELDDVVAQLRSWSEPRGGLLIVTADHDCGGLDDIVPAGVGVVPGATWRWGNHSNARVTVSAAGPGSEALAGVDADHRAVHAAIIAAIDGAAPEVPVALVPDGSLLEHRFRVAEQSEPSGLGDRLGRLQGLTLDGDGFGLAVGVEGVFPWQTHAVVVAIDVDPGAGTGVTAFDGSLTDAELPIDRVISTLRVAAPAGRGVLAPAPGRAGAGASVGRAGRLRAASGGAALRGRDPHAARRAARRDPRPRHGAAAAVDGAVAGARRRGADGGRGRGRGLARRPERRPVGGAVPPRRERGPRAARRRAVRARHRRRWRARSVRGALTARDRRGGLRCRRGSAAPARRSRAAVGPPRPGTPRTAPPPTTAPGSG